MKEAREQYRIIKEIGAGANGKVYLAEDTTLRRRVAIKELSIGHSHARDGSEAKDRLYKEARAVAALSHPNIVTIHTIEEQDGKPLIIME